MQSRLVHAGPAITEYNVVTTSTRAVSVAVVSMSTGTYSFYKYGVQNFVLAPMQCFQNLWGHEVQEHIDSHEYDWEMCTTAHP